MPTQRTGRSITIPTEAAIRLADLITAEDDHEIVATLREMMRSAEMTVRVHRERGERNNYAVIPDWRARGWAAVQLAQIKHGKPTQSIAIDVKTDSRAPMSDDDLRSSMLSGWEEIKSIGDEYVKAARHVLPAPGVGVPAQPADAELVDVDLPQ